MRKRWPWMLAVLAALGLMAGTLWIRTGVAGRDYGIPAEEIEADARERADVPGNWVCALDASETACAVLLYDPEDPAQCRFRLYAAREGKEGYFFLGGGNLSEVRDGVAVYDLRDSPDQAMLSANRPGVAQVKAADGTTVDVDPDRPFSLVLPRDAGDLIITDAQGAEVTYSQRIW